MGWGGVRGGLEIIVERPQEAEAVSGNAVRGVSGAAFGLSADITRAGMIGR